jgi:hypothetical protein
VERFNRTLCETLAKISERENEWDEHIESALFAYRTNRHSVINRTPFYMTYGRKAILPIEEMDEYEDTPDEMKLMKRTYELIELEQNRNEILKKIEQLQEKQKQKHDNGIKRETNFKIGNKVLLRDAAKEKQWSGKLSPKWKGPYYIHDIIGKGAYKLREMNGKVLRTPYNIKLLKRYYDRKEKGPVIFI